MTVRRLADQMAGDYVTIHHAQLALEARGHVPNADDGSAFVRFAADALLLIYFSSRR